MAFTKTIIFVRHMRPIATIIRRQYLTISGRARIFLPLPLNSSLSPPSTSFSSFHSLVEISFQKNLPGPLHNKNTAAILSRPFPIEVKYYHNIMQ
jgi:hypothetical protein